MSIKIMIPYCNSPCADTWLYYRSINHYNCSVRLEPDELENLVITSVEYEFFEDDIRLSEFALKFS